ncbi:MAG: alkaline phosphatase family protein [Angelakisella sp.]
MNGRLLYINLDGFGRYYFDAIQNKTAELPNITALMQDGVFFENAYTGIPSITCPMQCAIVSGAYSDKTGNCYKYYNGSTNSIDHHYRHNDAQTIAELLAEQDKTVLSIQQFAVEKHGCTREDKEHLYIQPCGDYRRRFDILCDLIETGTLHCGDQSWDYDRFPDGVLLYIDDLDSVGHNPMTNLAPTEKLRVKNVTDTLKGIDRCLGRLVALLKEHDLYEDTYLLLTTDHGMVHFTGKSHIDELRQVFVQQGLACVAVCDSGTVPKQDFDVLLTSHDIECQVYLRSPAVVDQASLKAALLKLDCVEQVMTTQELAARGVTPLFGQMLISPKEGAHFSDKHAMVPWIAATHDSLHEKCQHIFAVMSGPTLQKGLVYQPEVHNIDFMPTLCTHLGVPVMKDATGEQISGIAK